MRNYIAAALVAGSLAIGLTACSTGGYVQSGAVTAKAVEPDQAKPTTATFGQTWTWNDGLAVTISQPTPFDPDQYAAGATQAANVLFTVTVTNNSQESVKTTLSMVNVNSGGVAGSKIIDIENNLGGFAPQTPLLPGQQVSWNVAFSVTDPSNITMQFDLNDFDHDAVVFTS